MQNNELTGKEKVPIHIYTGTFSIARSQGPPWERTWINPKPELGTSGVLILSSNTRYD